MTMFPSFPKKHKPVVKQTELPAQDTAATARRPSSKQQLTYAHGWLGVIASGLLCLIFWFGGLSVFRAEIQAWSEAPFLMAASKPHTASVPIERQAFEGSLTLFRAIEAILPRYDYDPHEHISVILPQAAQPYYQFYIDLVAENHPASSMAEIQVDSSTGEVLGAINRYPLANFFYRLHYSGNMGKIGLYLIGVCALLLGFALFSGIWIQIKKLWQQFFLYRRDAHATTYLDSHRVMGVISLPFTAMIALTGLIFNLVIVYQATFALVLYQGNSKALLADAGYATHLTADVSGVRADMANITTLIRQTAEEKGPVEMARIHAYGDQNAMLELKGRYHGRHLAREYRRFYRVTSQEILFDGGVKDNQLQAGLEVLEHLHFGDFGGLGLKVMYFLLSIAVVAMIVMGNCLWVEKRKKQTDQYATALWLIPKMTLGVCLGLMGATFVSMLYVRLMPLHSGFSGEWVTVVFMVSLLCWLVASCWVQAMQSLIKYSLFLFSVLITLTLLLGLAQYTPDWLLSFGETSKATITIDVGLVLLAMVFGAVAVQKGLKTPEKVV